MKKRFSFVPWIFPKLLTPKNVVSWMPESSCFRTLFRSQCVNGSQNLLKAARQHFYLNFGLFLEKLTWKTSLLVGSEILGLFFNTLAAFHIYSRQNWEKLPQQVEAKLSSNAISKFQVQMQLSSKTINIFANFYCSFEISITFYAFWKKDRLHNLIISEVIASEDCDYSNIR